MLGAALSGAVSAAFDDTGLTKGFFYDANYNPIVQIVVGEKGMASDSVAAGNVAATIGNLAYKTSQVTATAGTATGEVVIGVQATGATGKYVQGTNRTLMSNFYNENVGLTFLNETQTYTRGEFITYSVACNVQERTSAGILKKGEYGNIHCLFCETLCLGELENPTHEMEEKITVDYSKMVWYEKGLNDEAGEDLELAVESRALEYIVDTGEIPMTRIGTSSSPVDFEYRGKMLFLGDEYYVKNIKGTTEVNLAKGQVLDDISSEGFTAEYQGYKFKIDHLIYSQEYQVAGILLDVEKPDGTVVQVQLSKMANGKIDNLEIAGVYAEESDNVASASIIVYDLSSEIILENGKTLKVGGKESKYWKVTFGTIASSTGSPWTDLDTSEYRSETASGYTVLNNITITYTHSFTLEEGEAIDYPATFKLVFNGFRTNDYVKSPCSGANEGNILLDKDEKYKLLLSFTGDDRQRYNDVRLDSGPFTVGDKFLVNGKTYEFTEYTEKENSRQMGVKLKNLFDGGTDTYTLNAYTTDTVFTSRAFEESSKNDKNVSIDAETNENDTDVFNSFATCSGCGTGSYLQSSRVLWFYGGDLYVMRNSTVRDVKVDPNVIGTLTYLELNGHNLYISALDEAGTNLNNDGDTDDVLIKIKNEESEYAYVDLYDRNYDSNSDIYYDQQITASLTDAASTALSSSTATIQLDEDDDVVLWTPSGGDKISATYGGDYKIERVDVCHPQEEVYPTVFIGTSETPTTLKSTITKADEGTSVTAGCCSFTVESFGVSVGAGTSATSATVNAVPANLVVPEISADLNKNLVIVGGPAVNGLTTVTADEIAAASQHYIVRKDGKKLIVAGWTAADTVDAGNALIKWLQDNAHA